MKRREFLRNTSIAAAAMSVLPEKGLFAGFAGEKVKIGIIGVGLRGQNHLNLLLTRDDVDIVAICDVDDRMLNMSKAMITKSGKPMPKVFTGNDYAWKNMLETRGYRE